MPTPTHATSHRQASGTVEVRLPWWAVVLPSLAFAALLLLIVGPGQAHAATGNPATGQLLGRILDLLTF